MGLMISVALNMALAGALVVVIFRARAKIVEEKVATFSGCLNALTFGLAPDDLEQRFTRAAVGVASLLDADADADVKWRLVRASYMRLFRKEPVFADLDEHVRALVYFTMKGEEEAELVWSYLGPALDGCDGFQEPLDHFTGLQLSTGQFQLEAPLARLYKKSVESKPRSLFFKWF